MTPSNGGEDACATSGLKTKVHENDKVVYELQQGKRD
ncbi:hypothetical protein INT81_06835 [Riemerella anatipestifer]|nr:hypothetical protein [Riemerella anatipestifer]